ncbi:MAG: hemolysin family protein [Gemmatimonadota bacterium]
MAVLIPTLVVTVLILLNGLFVAAEFAVVTVPRASVERRAGRGERWAVFLHRTVGDARLLDRYIATAQLGITLSSLGLGMYGEHLLAEWLGEVFTGWGMGQGRWIGAHAVATVVAIAFLTYWHVVIGEMVPKALALQQAERTVFAVAPLMRSLQFVMLPLVLLLNGVGNGVLRIVGVRRSGHGTESYRTPDELEYIVRESQAGGLLRKESARVVQELLDFSDLTAREVMVPRVQIRGIPEGAGPDELRSLLEEGPHTRYPVYAGSMDRIVGSVHVRDLVQDEGGRPKLRSESVQPLPFVPESLGLDRVLEALHRGGSRMAVVMDEHGGTAGLVTIEDIFEEVVGEVEGVPEMSRDAAGEVRALGRVRLETLGEMLGRSLEHEEVDTLSGLVLDLLGRPALAGDRVRYKGLEVEVLSVEGHGVLQARVYRTPAEPKA